MPAPDLPCMGLLLQPGKLDLVELAGWEPLSHLPKALPVEHAQLLPAPQLDETALGQASQRAGQRLAGKIEVTGKVFYYPNDPAGGFQEVVRVDVYLMRSLGVWAAEAIGWDDGVVTDVVAESADRAVMELSWRLE